MRNMTITQWKFWALYVAVILVGLAIATVTGKIDESKIKARQEAMKIDPKKAVKTTVRIIAKTQASRETEATSATLFSLTLLDEKTETSRTLPVTKNVWEDYRVGDRMQTISW